MFLGLLTPPAGAALAAGSVLNSMSCSFAALFPLIPAYVHSCGRGRSATGRDSSCYPQGLVMLRREPTPVTFYRSRLPVVGAAKSAARPSSPRADDERSLLADPIVHDNRPG